MLLLELLDHCVDPFFLLVPLLDLLILLQSSPKLHCFIEQVSCCTDLLLYLLHLHYFFLIPLLLGCWWSGWCELFSDILYLLLILINCLHNPVNLLCCFEFISLHGLWNLLLSSFHFFLQSFYALPFLLGLIFSLFIDYFQRLLILCCLLQFG
jgi:hypothetical protein